MTEKCTQHQASLIFVLNLRDLVQSSHLWVHSKERKRKIRIILNAKEKLLNHKASIDSRTFKRGNKVSLYLTK